MPMLDGMRRSWLRRILTPILGLVFAVSMSASVVQAAQMAAKMTITPVMDIASDHGQCPDCDHGAGGMKRMDCHLAFCGAPGVATLALTFVVVVPSVAHNSPARLQSSLVGWAHPPDPYPPRLRALD